MPLTDYPAAKPTNVAGYKQLGLGWLKVVPLVLSGGSAMKTAMIALFALVCSATAWAGTVGGGTPLPDAGSSLLLLGMGVAAVGAVRHAFRR